MTIFVTEGRKSMFRFTYAICKVNKDCIKSVTKAELFNDYLSKKSKQNTKFEELSRWAFKMKLGKASALQFSKSNKDDLKVDHVLKDDTGELIDYLPTHPIKSEIVNFDQFIQFWRMVPNDVRIRIP